MIYLFLLLWTILGFILFANLVNADVESVPTPKLVFLGLICGPYTTLVTLLTLADRYK